MADNDTSFDTIFCGAIEIASGAERAAFMARACGADDELRRRVERLVDAHFQAGSFLEAPPNSPTLSMASASSTEIAGTVIGPYKLLQPIGEGGMGTVYMAEQTHPVRRNGRAQAHQGRHGQPPGPRPVRGRTPGAGPDGPPQHRQGLRRRHDRQLDALTS